MCPTIITVCVQIFAGHIFHERPAPNNFHDFNFTNGGLQLQTCTVCVRIFHFHFRERPLIHEIHENKVPQKFVNIRYCTLSSKSTAV